ncbi:hypothetical protein EQW76_00665 [Rhizobium sp. rho-13.1]|uniref:hypothetical protein n=1 Tax=Rhizobium sp. rho-13.1 TaxID=2506431 RepID=UPI00115F3EED|nr:hypothetical protein [Rhizobium sp. rho-13.1]TQX91285.1 hypothetical protein EQW76_00665 [Rhizobium sp. rho-13.1]
MAFERAKIEIKAASVGTGFKVTLGKMRGSSAKMKFSLTVALAKTFGWSDGDKLEVFIGTGSDHGMMRFRKNNSVGDAPVVFRKATKGDWVSVSLGHQPAFVDEAQTAAWVQFEQIEDGFVEVVLPRWADKTAPAKAKDDAAAPTAPVRQPPAARPTVPQRSASMTAGLMGDPPPNRREMLAKMGDVKV